MAGGKLDLFEGFDIFKSTGSYFGGLQAGWATMLAPRLLLGAEADVSFPSELRGAQTVVVGIQPDVAIAIVQLGLTLQGVATALDLEEGLELLRRLPAQNSTP